MATNEPTLKRHASQEARQNMARARLSLKQERFVREYAASGNASSAARKAGYKLSKATHSTGWENLQKPAVKSAIAREIARIELEITPKRVQRRLDEISHEAQAAGQFGVSVRAEELLGKSVGMFIDRSLQLTGQLNDSHIAALIEIAQAAAAGAD